MARQKNYVIYVAQTLQRLWFTRFATFILAVNNKLSVRWTCAYTYTSPKKGFLDSLLLHRLLYPLGFSFHGVQFITMPFRRICWNLSSEKGNGELGTDKSVRLVVGYSGRRNYRIL